MCPYTIASRPLLVTRRRHFCVSGLYTALVTSARTPPGPLYAAIGLGSFLLFLIQPMAARFILPWFGGGPTVWSTCLLFFQVALLAGYGYAHLSRSLSVRRQAQLHF